MVIEAVFEEMNVKKQVFKILDKVVKKGVCLLPIHLILISMN